MTGAVIALLVREPLLAVPLSLASHFFCDAIPHFGIKDDELFGRKFNIILVTDFIVAISLMIVLGFMFPAQKWLIWSCMIAAASPDLMWAYYYLYLQKLKKRKPRLGLIAKFHSVIQWSQTAPGAALEAGWFVIMALIITGQK